MRAPNKRYTPDSRADALSSAGHFAPSESALGASDSLNSFSVSLHARFYWLSLFNGARTNPRVFFLGWGDKRRLEPWVSLGVERLQRISRERSYAANDSIIRYTGEYTGLPLGAGIDYRFTPLLSSGLSMSLTPLVGQSMTRYRSFTTGTGSTSTRTEITESYDTFDRTNFQCFLGFGLRYTWTMF